MKRKIVLCFALVWGSIFPLAVAQAQPVYSTYPSLEARVAQAQAVVRGSISNCTGIFVERQGGYFGGYKPDGTKRPDGVMRYTLTVQVNEMIKGTMARTIELVQETSADDKRFEQWAEAHTPFLFFIGDGAWSNLGGRFEKTNSWSSIRLGEAVLAERGYSGDWPLYLMDFTRLTNSKAILAEARKSAKVTSAGELKLHKFAEIPGGPLWSSLLVPVQPQLEKVAKHLITAPEKYIDAKESPATRAWMHCHLREAGVGTLSHFKSARNVRLLKSLLTDPDFFLGGPEYETTRQYPVRAKAHEVLTQWGVDVPKPSVEEMILPKDKP